MAARKNKVDISENWRERISTSMLMNRLKDHIDSKVELAPTQLKAIELILQRTVASLSSVEQTVHNPDDVLTDEQISDKFQQLINAHPHLLQRLLAMQAKANPSIALQQSADNHSTDTSSTQPIESKQAEK